LKPKKFTEVSKEKAKYHTKFVHDTMLMQNQPLLKNESSKINIENSVPSIVQKEETMDYNEYEDWFFNRNKPTDHPLLTTMRELLTRPVIAQIGSKNIGFKTHHKRISDLKTDYKKIKVEHLDAQAFSRLQMI